MSKQNIEESVESRVCFEQLEDWVREKIQGWVQELLEEEVTELLGRGKSERRRDRLERRCRTLPGCSLHATHRQVRCGSDAGRPNSG